MLAMLERMTVDEYLAFDRAAERPHEYIAGTLCRREGANFQHCQTSSNVLRAVGNALQASPFRVYAPPMRVRATADVYLYPDVSIGFGAKFIASESRIIICNKTFCFYKNT